MPAPPYRIAYIGNFGPPNSTENDLKWSLEQLGHTVLPLQEELSKSWIDLDDLILNDSVDMILWTRTAGLSAQVPEPVQRSMQFAARRHAIPTVGYHLDRWWGLSREPDVLVQPWFKCDYVFTADGAHDADWEFAGVNHHWMPPAVCARKCQRGAFRSDFAFDFAFVGSWMGGYHEEWPHRQQMVDHLRRRYGRRLGLFPQRQGDGRIDGPDRADLFATAKVVIGDSCLVPLADGSPMHHYCSDRVFETLGQGGLLLHPLVDGILGDDPARDLLLTNQHAIGWKLYDWDDLDAKIQSVLDHPAAAARIATAGFQFVSQNHTYTQRMADMLTFVLGGS